MNFMPKIRTFSFVNYPLQQLVYATVIGLFSCLTLTGLSGCASTEPEILSEEEYYKKAKAAINNETYMEASKHLEDLETYHPFGRYAEQAQLDLLFARYNSLDSVGATAAADRFIRLHPESPNVDYAYYIKGLAAYYADETLTMRFFPIDPTSRDPGQARAAFQAFSILVNQFPDSSYSPDAQRRMIAIKNRLATYELHVAQYYVQRRAFVAALSRTGHIIENYPQTMVIADALALRVELARILGLKEHGDDALIVLATSFPNHESFDANMRFAGNQIKLKSRDITQIFTFDFFED